MQRQAKQLCSTILVMCLLSFCAFTAQAQEEPTPPKALTAEEAGLAEQAKETNKREELIKKQSSLAADVQEKNKAKAGRIAEKGHELFGLGAYKKASQYFAKSIQLDASVDQYYYEFGLCLYKMNLYAKALTYLNMTEGTGVNQTELNYYQALSHYKIKNDEPAYMKFKHVEEAKDEILSPLAAMYAGIIDKSSERFDEAKQHFNFVLEFSKDPEMDKRAEAQIDDIIRQQQLIERSKRKWAYSAYLGTAYDSNVLNAAEVNASLNKKAYRALYGAAVSYKALYSRKNTLTPQFWVTDMYSLDENFKSDANIQSADPLQAEISLPYKHYFRSGTLSLTPAYQALVMSLNGGNRNLIYDAATLATSYTVSYADDWLTTYRLDLAKENFSIKNIAEIDDQSSFRYSFLFSQTNLLDDDGYRTINMDILYANNDTVGDNFRYTKYQLGFGGSWPMGPSNKVLGFLRADYFMMSFPDNNNDRDDNGFIVNHSVGYTMDDKSTFSFNLQYYSNSSSLASYDYNKFVLTAIYSYNSGFF